MHERFKGKNCVAAALLMLGAAGSAAAQRAHNVIIFVADGLRRESVTERDMPTFVKVRRAGVDFQNSHAVFPTFTTANASVIATGHGVGDTGDYSNTLYPGTWLTKPLTPSAAGTILPFLESDDLLANMNAQFANNYLGEKTLLSLARAKGFNVASIGKVGPTAIQQNDAVGWDKAGLMENGGAIIIDDATGSAKGVPLPPEVFESLDASGLGVDAPLRTNGFAEGSQSSNGFSGDASNAGTKQPNQVQEQWFADVSTKVLLPRFAAEEKPFVLLFWSRDPDGTQHNQGDSLQSLTPGINGETSHRALQNADHCLKQLLDWLDAHPAIKASTDVFLTSDHGFATISRRDIAADGTHSAEPSAALEYELVGKEAAEPRGTLPAGFLAVDLSIRENLRVFDPAVRATTGPSVYAQVNIGGETSQHPQGGSALLGDHVLKLDGSDATLLIASNAGSDLIYAPTKNAAAVRETVRVLSQLDYVGGIFVDDAYCVAAKDCGGALPMSSIGMVGKSAVPRPAIVVNYKVFYQVPGDLQSAVQIADTTLQQGQGNHGGFGRDQTFNNMAAMGPDFKAGVIDKTSVGNIDIAPTLAKILGIDMPSVGSIRGRVLKEALKGSGDAPATAKSSAVSPPSEKGARTVMEYQEVDGVRYFDRACVVHDAVEKHCE